MTIHRIQILELVASEVSVEAASEAKRRDAIVTAWDEAETARAEARKAGTA